MPGVFLLAPGPVFADPNQQSVHTNATVTTDNSAVFTGYGSAEISLFINVKAAPTGALPTLQYTLQEVDPGDGLTVIGPTVSSSVIVGIGIQRITLESAFGGSIKVSWAVTGTLPSFTQVYATLVGKQASVKITDGTDTALVSAAGALNVDGSSVTQPVSAASLPLPAGAAQEHVTAVSPNAARLSDGVAFYDAAKTGQLPAALSGGRLDVNSGAWLGSTAPTVGQKIAANSLPTVLASDQGSLPVNVVGSEGNAWAAVAVAAGGLSATIDARYTPFISIFGNSSGNTILFVQLSQDNVNFYDSDSFTTGSGNFGFSSILGGRYIRLRSSNARTLTVTIAGKG